MTGTTWLYLIPVLVQLVAAVLALSLIVTTGRRLAWLLLALAFILMSVRRLVAFAVAGGWHGNASGNGLDLVLASVISLLTLAGVARMGKVFRQARSDAESSKSAAVQLARSEKRYLLAEVLRGLGYRVAVASDGVEALEHVTAHARDVDLVLTDVVMPRMSGVELYREMGKIAPHVLFLLSSGYSESAAQGAVADNRPVAFLAKPYGIDELARAVRDALDRRARPTSST